MNRGVSRATLGFLGGVLACVLWAGVVVAAGPGPKQQGPPLPRWRDNSGMIFIRGGELTYRGREARVRSFYMDQYEVTNDQFCEFLNDGNAKHWNADQEIEKRSDKYAPKPGKDQWPVYAVSWHDADAYARWAGKRLPTDAEWLWASAGKEGRRYAWGNEPISPGRANYGGNVGHPQPVGSYSQGRSPEGIYDLTGNVAEWCDDWFEPAENGSAERLPATENGPRKIRRAGCYAMPAESQSNAEFGTPSPDYRPKCIGFRCVRPARRVLVLLGENFAEMELAGYTGVLSWATHTTKQGNYMIPKDAPAAEVPRIEVVVAGFAPEVHGMGGLTVRPHMLVEDLTDEDVDRFDAVAIPACVGGGRGQHTWAGQADLESDRAVAIVRRVHQNGGIISTMCAGAITLRKAKLPLPKREGEAVAYDKELRTATSLGPGVSLEAACLLVRELVTEAEYRSFRRYNPWLFGGEDQFPPRVKSLQ